MKSSHGCAGLGGALLLLSAVISCEAPNNKGATVTPTLTSVTIPGPARAVYANAEDALAASWCDRKVTCGDVGLGRHYVDFGACAEEQQGEAHALLVKGNCTQGVERARLDRCLDAIHRTPCSTSMSAIRIACRPKTLCGW